MRLAPLSEGRRYRRVSAYLTAFVCCQSEITSPWLLKPVEDITIHLQSPWFLSRAVLFVYPGQTHFYSLRSTGQSVLPRACRGKAWDFFYRVHPCILCTFVFMSRKRFTCSVVMVTVTFCIWLWSTRTYALLRLSEWVREWERDYYILRLSYEWQLPNTEEYYIGAS